MLSRILPYLWITPFISFLLGYCALTFFHHNKKIATPAIIGKTVDKALISLNEHNLTARISDKRDDADLPEGTVLAQIPVAGTIIKTNQTVYITISQKKCGSITPNLRGKSLHEAQALVEQQAQKILAYTIPADAPDNSCIAQFPQAGTLSSEKPIIVYVARANTKPVLMPNFIGKSLDEIVSFLSLHDSAPTVVHSRRFENDVNHHCTQCMVVDQRPLPGTLVILNADKPLPVQLQVD